jgi:capsule polysaccharide export protein KpsE/RkpR
VKVEYVANDPAVTKQTLEILTEVFTRKNRELFSGQNENVIVYFDEATQKAYDKLQKAEQKLFEFNKSNNIVDYDQQIAMTSSDKTALSDKLSTLEMQYAGAFSAMKSAEETLKRRGSANLQSQEIMSLRSQLSKINSQILELELNGKNKTDTAAKVARLKEEAAKVSADIKSSLDEHYANTHSAQGAPVEPLLDEYVRNTILVEELKSQLELMRKQKESFAGQYEKLVPLGAEIRKIRREVEVAEQEYMAQLDGLKQSKLSQQNIELASQLRVIDPPYYPVNPTNMNLLLLMLFGFFGALLLTGAGVFTADMIDNTLNKPSYASKATNFPVLGAIPNITSAKWAKVQLAEEQLVRQLLLKIQQKKEPQGPFVVGMLSSHSGEGKTAVASTLARSLQQMGISTLRLLPDSAEHQSIHLDNTTAFYSPLQGVDSAVTVAHLAGERVYNHKVVLVEFPALLETTYPVSLLPHLDLILVTVKADRTWQQADKTVFDNIQKVTTAPIEIVLNGVRVDYIEDFVGEPVKPLSVSDHAQAEAPKQVNEWESEPAIMNS